MAKNKDHKATVAVAQPVAVEQVVPAGNMMHSSGSTYANGFVAVEQPVTTQVAEVVPEQQAPAPAPEQLTDAQVMQAYIADLVAKQVAAKLAAMQPTKVVAPKQHRTKLLEQNGETKPGAGTIGARIWDEIDTLSTTLGRAASIAEVRTIAALQNDLPVNLTSIYARWRKFNGVSGRVVAPITTEVATMNRRAADKIATDEENDSILAMLGAGKIAQQQPAAQQ